MRKLIVLTSLFICSNTFAQRATTAAEKAEDARVLKIISSAMPHIIDNWEDEGERSFGESKLDGISGFYNNTNFATRDVFEHQYTITYRMVNASDAVKKEMEAAKDRNDFAYIESATQCQISVYINSSNNDYKATTEFKKATSSYTNIFYKDEAGKQFNCYFFGNTWGYKPEAINYDDGYGNVYKEYVLQPKANNKIGTIIQSIQVVIKANAATADFFAKKINWESIKAMLGTGAVQDAVSETNLKKYFVEKPVKPIAGNNSLSFIYIDEDGKEKTFTATSTKHDLTNAAILRNHNENPKVLEKAEMNIRMMDDKDINKTFRISLPIIRTTGTVTATAETDYNYETMWRGSIDATTNFLPQNITIQLTKWPAIGDFIEGTFSGTATLKSQNDYSSEKPTVIIKNGKFKIRRIADQIKNGGL